MVYLDRVPINLYGMNLWFTRTLSCLTDLDEIEEYSEQAGRFKARAMEHQQSLRKRGRRRQSRGPRREWQVSTSTPCWQNDGVGYCLCVEGFKATGL